MLSLYVLNIEYIRTEYSVQCSRILNLNYNSNSSCFLSSILFTLLRNRSNFVLETLFPSGRKGIYIPHSMYHRSSSYRYQTKTSVTIGVL